MYNIVIHSHDIPCKKVAVLVWIPSITRITNYDYHKYFSITSWGKSDLS